MNDLTSLYDRHAGKSSDKWDIYLRTYERVLQPFQAQPVRLLEIGIQNGGSLEIWAQYFPNARILLGVDVDPACGTLRYDDPRIHVLVGDAGLPDIAERIRSISDTFDVVIEDGSHTSSDIVRAFARYFPLLADGGVFIAEDLHCSYWARFDGGLFHPTSSMAFFKELADVLHHQHWGVERTRAGLLERFAQRYAVDFSDADLAAIHSVEFVNSVCIVRRAPAVCNLLGPRHVVGVEERVAGGNLALHGSTALPFALDESGNRWAGMAQGPLQAHEGLLQQIAAQRQERMRSEQALRHELEALRAAHETLRLEHAAATVALAGVHASTSWRVSAPVRWAGHQVLRARHFARLLPVARQVARGWRPMLGKAWRLGRQEGWSGLRRGLAFVAQQAQDAQRSTWTVAQVQAWLGTTSEPPEALRRSVLLIAETSIAQCLKYRVTQKAEMLEELGYQVTVLPWADTGRCLDGLSLHGRVIFYRVPAFHSVTTLLDEARRLGLSTLWEVDDLVFDRAQLEQSETLKRLPASALRGILDGADLYRTAMLACDAGIASTTGLAQAMRAAGVPQVAVVENALDRESLQAAEAALQRLASRMSDGIVRIVYGSGTSTHDVDFFEVAPALLAVMEAHPHVRFRLIGTLNLPEAFARVADRVERIGFVPYTEYLYQLAECDINIAPLEPGLFNDSKSNIKFLEAAILRLPTVCSPRSAFREVVVAGETGYLCEGEPAWRQALTELVQNRALREQVGAAADAAVRLRYAPGSIARAQLAPALAPALAQGAPASAARNLPRILSVNVYYSPRSFGGATLVAEELNAGLAQGDAFEMQVLTALPAEVAGLHGVRRYAVRGAQVWGIGLPEHELGLYENEAVAPLLDKVLNATTPALVHLHSIQGIGIGVARACLARGIPYVITLHDAWWLCLRQFMVDGQGNFCNQTRIDPEVCARCTLQPEAVRTRQAALRVVLDGASRLLAPSHYTAGLYRANGVPAERIEVHRNGIRPPGALPPRVRRAGPVVFGYVGGHVALKGADRVRDVFARLGDSRAHLRVADPARLAGASGFPPDYFADCPSAEVVAPYGQDTLDAFFSQIDVLLFPTRCKESFGLTVREAVVRGVWVISTDAGGVTEGFVPGESGTLIPLDDDGSALEAAVRAALDRFEQWAVGERIPPPPTTHLAFIEDQVQELARIYRGVLS